MSLCLAVLKHRVIYTRLSRTIARIESFLCELGFAVKTGPEIEDGFHNFDALNIPANHPARADHDTFYFNPDMMLRTQTSGVQIRTMEAEKPPLRIISLGACIATTTIKPIRQCSTKWKG